MNSDIDEEKKAQQFLKSWKVAAKKLGPELFTVKSASVDVATDRNDIRPNPEAIEQYFNNNPDHQPHETAPFCTCCSFSGLEYPKWYH